MIQVILASDVHIKDIADFQCRMAMETENLKLDREIVEKAVEHLIKHPHYGQYYLAVNPNQPEKVCGSLLVTYENDQSFWIQSVYVRQEHRRKGIFTTLFKTATQKSKLKAAKSMQLYREKENERAKKTYESLGMYCNGNEFIGYEFVYGHPQTVKHLSQPIQQVIKIEEGKPGFHNEKYQQLKHISGQRSNKNCSLSCFYQNELVGYCEYFTEFSDWRFGLIVYLNYFSSVASKQRIVLDAFIKYLLKNFETKVTSVRVIGKGNELKILKEIQPNMHLQVYDVMRIDL